MIGVWEALSEILHCVLQGCSGAFVLAEFLIESRHEDSCTPVIDVPQCRQNSAGARIKQSADQAQEFITAHYNIQAGATAAEGHQFRGQGELV